MRTKLVHSLRSRTHQQFCHSAAGQRVGQQPNTLKYGLDHSGRRPVMDDDDDVVAVFLDDFGTQTGYTSKFSFGARAAVSKFTECTIAKQVIVRLAQCGRLCMSPVP